jgi:hypothetical protein
MGRRIVLGGSLDDRTFAENSIDLLQLTTKFCLRDVQAI